MTLDLTKNELLNLPVSVKSWILLRHYLDQTWDMDVFIKVIDDYYSEMPLFEVYILFSLAEKMVDDSTFQELIDRLFKAKATNQSRID